MDMNIQDFLKTTRIEQMLSIQELAKRSGVSASFISRIERGNRKPSSETLERLAPHLEVDLYKLLEIAKLLQRRDKHSYQLEEVLAHPALYVNGKLIDDETRKAIQRLLP